MILIFGRNNSLISRIIRTRTFSLWSHVGILIDDHVLESVGPDGVQLTRIDAFKARYTETEIRYLEGDTEKALNQLGKPFDLNGLRCILIGRTSKALNKWFCSDLVALASNAIPDESRKWATPEIIYRLSHKQP